MRNHYLALLTGSGQAEQTHDQLKDYYLALAGDTPHQPSLADLAPLIEVVYHACRAGAYDEAEEIRWERISQQSRYYDIHVLGAYETSLNIMLQFFPNGDTTQDPQVSKASDKSWILNQVGLCLMSLGRLATAVPFFERKTKMQLEYEDWHNASTGYRNLAELNANLGRLAASATAAAEALTLARRAENKRDERNSLMYRAWAAHLRGDIKTSTDAFDQAETLELQEFPNQRFLNRNAGIHHAIHLHRTSKDRTKARKITEDNLSICKKNRWLFIESRCHRILGELAADEGGAEEIAAANDHFDTALTIARSISYRPALIEALLARGRWAAKLVYADLTGAPEGSPTTKIEPGHLSGLTALPQAFADLREALGYATDGGYRIYEADGRIALAWAHLASNSPAEARQEASRAQTMSMDMGYHWGQVDAAEILNRLP